MYKSVVFQSFSLISIGLLALIFPAWLSGLILDGQAHDWLQILGILAVLIGAIYWFIWKKRLEEFILFSIFGRFTVAFALLFLVFFKRIPDLFLAVSLMDAASATWTAIEAWIPLPYHLNRAFKKIKDKVIHTPILEKEINGMQLAIKCENQQKIGAFKARGALNAAMNLSFKELQKGLVTHSSGNHAQAIALAAKELGTKAFVVMPVNAPTIKKNGVISLGGEVITCEPTLQARESGVAELQKIHKATFIHPFDNFQVICGQATVAMEILSDWQPEVIIAPVGGGGLLSGTALAARYFGKNIDVYGAEPTGALDAFFSLNSGNVEKAGKIETIADGLLTNLSPLTLKIIRRHIKGILPVTDLQIKDAMKKIEETFGQKVEPSGAVSVAAALTFAGSFKNKKVCCIISGGNVDADTYKTLTQ